MNNRMRIVFLCMLMLVVAMGPKPSGSGKDSPFEVDGLVNAKAPDFTLKDMQGRNVTLSSLKGKAVILNFWATWCPPCKAEMPSLNKLYLELRGRGLEVIAVSTDSSLMHVKDYLAKARLDFTIVHDEKRSVLKQYKVFSMPTTFLINREGVIAERIFGEEEWTDADIRKRIEKLL